MAGFNFVSQSEAFIQIQSSLKGVIADITLLLLTNIVFDYYCILAASFEEQDR